MRKVLAIIICNMSFLCMTFGQWQEANNGLTGGYIQTLAVDTVTKYIYAGTEFGGGLFRSTDDGLNWKPMNDGFTSGENSITALTVKGSELFAGARGNDVFLITGNGTKWTNAHDGIYGSGYAVNCFITSDDILFAGTSNGVFISTDNGKSWVISNNGLTNTYISTLAAMGTRLFAGTSGGGIFLSEDNGNNWTEVSSGLLNKNIYSLTMTANSILAGTSGGIFISTDYGSNWTASNNGFTGYQVYCMAKDHDKIYCGSGTGVFLSTDNGASWNNSGMTDIEVYSLVVNGNKVFAGTHGKGVFCSNGGNSWIQVNNGLSAVCVSSMALSTNKIFAGTYLTGLFSSTDNGNTWTNVDNQSLNSYQYQKAVVAKGTNIFVGTYTGVYRSTDNGAAWTTVNAGLNNQGIFSLAISGTKIYAGTQEGDVYVSANNGDLWSPVSNGLPRLKISCLASDGVKTFAGTEGGGAFLLNNNTNTWMPVNFGLNSLYINSLTISGTNLLAGAMGGIYISSDNGTSWVSRSNGLTEYGVIVTSIAVYGNAYYAGTLKGVYSSIDNGNNWTLIDEGLPHTAVRSVIISGTNLYAGTHNGFWKRPLSDIKILNVSATSLSMGSVDKSTATFNITSNTNWRVVNSAPWLTLNKTSGNGNALITMTSHLSTPRMPATALVVIKGDGVTDKIIAVSLDASGEWQQISNGIYGGYISAIAIDPSTNRTYIGTESNGIFSSSDDGTNWTQITKGSPYNFSFIKSIAITGNYLFAASQLEGGVLLSKDYGKTWAPKNNGLLITNVNGLAVSKNKIFAGTSGGVFLSTDYGNNWIPVNNGLNLSNCYVTAIASSDGKIYVTTFDGMFISVNDGSSWTKFDYSFDYNYVDAIAINGANIFAGSWAGIYLSTDYGTTWKSISSGLPYTDIISLAISANRVFAGTYSGGVFLSTNNGSSWTSVNNGNPSNTVNCMAIKGSKIFAGTGAGVTLSENYGASWRVVNKGIPNNWVQSLINNGTTLFAGSYGNGVFTSNDNGSTWSAPNIGLSGNSLKVWSIAYKGNTIMAGTERGIFKSNDNANSWTEANNGIPNPASRYVYAIQTAGDKIYAGTDAGVFVSSDNGSSWIEKNNGLTYQNVSTLTCNGNTIYAGTDGGGVFVSIDEGNTWTVLNNGLSDQGKFIYAIAVKENSIFIGTAQGIYISTNNSGWTSANDGLSYPGVADIIVCGSNLIVATYGGGVFLSTNNATTWTAVNNGLSSSGLNARALSVKGTNLYVGTFSGVWKRPITDLLVVAASPKSLTIEYPDYSTARFNIISNTSWTVSSSASWLTALPDSGSCNATIELTALANPSKDSRKATITVSSPGLPDQLVSVTQKGNGRTTGSIDIDVYPNPAKDHITITVGYDNNNPAYTIKIMNMLGNVVFETRINQSQYELNITSWNMKGTYLLQVYDNYNKVIAAKTIIVK